MKTIFKYIKPYWFIAILAPIAMIVEVMADLYQPQKMATIIDVGIKNSDMSVILENGTVMLLLVVVGGIGGFLSAIFSATASRKFANDLRKDCFGKVINLSFEQTDKFTTGSLVTRITNDITTVQQLVGMSIRMLVRTAMLFGGGIIAMLGVNPKFGYILIAVLPIELALIFLFLHKAAPLFSAVQNRLDDVNAVVQENVTGARVVKAYVREEYECDRFNTSNVNLAQTSLKVNKIMACLSPFLTLFLNVTVIFIFIIGGADVINGVEINGEVMKVGQISAGISYVSMILSSVMMIGMMSQTITRARASLARINEVLASDPVVKSGDMITENGCGEIKINNISFHYPNSSGQPVIKALNLVIPGGDTVAILGSTGSGKTTLVNLIPRFYDTNEGEILVDGINVRDYNLECLRNKMGIVPQKTELFTGTIAENIKWGDSSASDEAVVEACKIAQADDFIRSFQDGYDTIIGEKGSSLSGGQKQRLAIARAILRKPQILIFDDSTSALDLATEARLYKAIRENLQGTTIVLVAQRVASVQGAKKIIVIDNGEIVASGTNEELLNQSTIYQNIYYSQLKIGGVIDAN